MTRATRLDLEHEEVIRDFVLPSLKSEPIWIKGREIPAKGDPPYTSRTLLVSHTDEPAEAFAARFPKEAARKDIHTHVVFRKGKDVTDELMAEARRGEPTIVLERVGDFAVVCESGHIYSPRWQQDVPLPHNFCRICRAKLRSECPACGQIIDPAEFDPRFEGLDLEDGELEDWSPPGFCPYCAEPFPWTRRKLEAVERFLTVAKGLSKQEQEEIRGNWEFLLAEVPETPVAAYKFNQALSKMGSDAAGVAKKIAMDVATDWVKKYLSGQMPPPV